MSGDPALDKLKRKIQEAKKNVGLEPFKGDPPQSLVGKFFNVGVELVSGVFVGVGLGLFIDWAFGTFPWGLISLFILGSVAGMLNVYRALTPRRPGNNKKDTDV